jgi:hypothetical protein
MHDFNAVLLLFSAVSHRIGIGLKIIMQTSFHAPSSPLFFFCFVHFFPPMLISLNQCVYSVSFFFCSLVVCVRLSLYHPLSLSCLLPHPQMPGVCDCCCCFSGIIMTNPFIQDSNSSFFLSCVESVAMKHHIIVHQISNGGSLGSFMTRKMAFIAQDRHMRNEKCA